MIDRPEWLTDKFLEDCRTGQSSYKLADKYRVAPSTIRERRIKAQNRGLLDYAVEDYPCLVYDDHIELEGDCIVVSDLEIPYHDGELLARAIGVARRFGIKALVVAGDIVALDALSFFDPEDTDDGSKFTVDDSLAVGEKVLQSLFEWFDIIKIIKGNHEQRGTRAKEIGFFNMMQRQWGDLGDLEISYYKWLVVKTERGDKRIEHVGNYSKIPGSVVRDRAETEQADVAGGHTHHFSQSFSKDGQHQAIDLGHCTRPETRYYKTVNGTTRHPKWISGFWMLRKGYWYGFTKEFTDWSWWLGEPEVARSVQEEGACCSNQEGQ